jgi:pilus assembly protein CpaC
MTKRIRTAATILGLLAVFALWAPARTMAQDTPALQKVLLTAGRSTVLATTFDITRIAVTNPAVADATVVAPREILIDGKSAGTISLIVWGDGARAQYDLVVDQPVNPLQQQLRGLFPGEDITVTVNEEAITLSGSVSSNSVKLLAAEIAAKTASKAHIINLLQVPGGEGSQQVLLQVRFAEVNRQAITEAGVALFTGQSKENIGRVTTEQFSNSPNFQPDGSSTFSDFLNLFLFNKRYDVGALLKALQQRGFLQSLAEPNLIAYNGKEASFLAGGEVPIPVVQGGTGATSGSVTIEYKEFGVRLNFTPTIAGDVIRLHVAPEVSALDFANGITLNGFRVPALTTRRADTEVELRDGQSFAIAGLLDNTAQIDRQSIPGLGSLPIVGYLFKSRSKRLSQTELMVLITPHLIKPLNPDEVPELPTDSRQFLPTGGKQDAKDGSGTADGPSSGSARDR